MKLHPVLLSAALSALPMVQASDLVLLEKGSTDYQIVLPAAFPAATVGEDLTQAARLIQTAFQANGAKIDVVSETTAAPGKSSIFLGDTRFARDQGIAVTTLRDWSYVHRAVGKDIIIAGHDHSPAVESDNPRRPYWNRLGTAKATVDFLREFMGVRFLYPDLSGYQPLRQAADVDLAGSPALEFLPRPTVRIPAGLSVEKTPLLRLNTAHPEGGSFYDLAHNRFPRVDMQFGSHTWGRAIPAAMYEEHPEYFALINGERLKPASDDSGQFCLSHPDVRELIYRDAVRHLDKGLSSVDLGQPDGFRECQCEACEALYGTGKDWGEKIWIFHREVAARLHQSHPGREVTLMSYILTAVPPKTFTAFPPNTGVMLTGTNEEDIAPWSGIEVPRGFTGYLYNWCPNLGTRYTPMRTPGFIETQVKRLADARVQALLRDGPGQLFGLEGPVYYTMGRMFDDPRHLTARALVAEFCEAAFAQPGVVHHMTGFYDDLYQAIALYSDQLGTRSPLWTHKLYPDDARARKTITDPISFIASTYPPVLLANLETRLSQSEKLATAPKIRERLALVRSEFDYLKHLATVAHLHQAWQMVPDEASLHRLLDAIDTRNAYIDALFPGKDGAAWRHAYFPLPGHSRDHLRLAHDGYQEPYANTCYNWDTERMRQSPPVGQRRLAVPRVPGTLEAGAVDWDTVASHELALLPPLQGLPRHTTVKLLRDDTALHLRFEAELGDITAFTTLPADRDLENQESVAVTLMPGSAPNPGYHFAQGPVTGSRYDAIRGLIADVMDPRHGRNDPTWNGEWESVPNLDPKGKKWRCDMRIPFATLGADPPPSGAIWKANFSRNLLLNRGRIDRAVWSSTGQGADEPGDIEFE